MKKRSFSLVLAVTWAVTFGYSQEVSQEGVVAEVPSAEQVTVAQQPTEGEEQMSVPSRSEISETEEAVSQAEITANMEQTEGFVAAREEVKETAPKPAKQARVSFNPTSQRDPTLSPDDFLLLQYREQQRLAAIEAERQRKLAEERRKREEAERLRQLELERIKDPTREVRGKIRIGGVIGQEVFIGSKIYTVGNRVYGARIVEVNPDYVIFSYKGHRFRKNVKI